MNSKIATVCAILILTAVAFWAGRMDGLHSASLLQTKNDVELQKELLELERSVLTNAVAQSNTMATGPYTMELRYAGKPEQTFDVQLEFSNGQTVTKSPLMSFVQAGNIISWSMPGFEEGPSENFIGIIDGKTMWGQAYKEPGVGWHQGEPPAYGVWRPSPKLTK